MKRAPQLPLAIVAVILASSCFPNDVLRSTTTRKSSPDGLYDIIEKVDTTRGGDHFTEVWITGAIETRRSSWHRIGRRIPGWWAVRWRTARDLLLTEQSEWPEQAKPFGVHRWRALRIETRAGPRSRVFRSPEGGHTLTVWSGVDSRGAWSAAKIQTFTVPMNDAGDDVCELIDEGTWKIDVKWLAEDRLSIEVTPRGDQPLPAVRQEWWGIAISVRRGDRRTR